MKEKYRQIYPLLEQLGPWQSRLEQMHKIIRDPLFRYEQKDGGDVILNLFLRSSYWLDKELFDDSYLYNRKIKKLLPMQQVHLKMVTIGADLLAKGFPLMYQPTDYNVTGPSQLSIYVKTFAEQCQKTYALSRQKISHKKQPPAPERSTRIRE